MSQFNYAEYQKLVESAQSEDSGRIGFFKLNEGEMALARLNIGSTDDLQFASVHKPVFGKKFAGISNPYAGISCLNVFGSYENVCPFCKAAKEPDSIIGKSSKRVYVEMMVSYKDNVTGNWSTPTPMIWERPAGFSKELATKLKNYGDLRQVLFTISRTGTGTETRYSLDYAVPMIFKPELIPVNFTAFDNFKINKHSYWEKTAQELEQFVSTGTFETNNTTAESNSNKKAYAAAEQFSQSIAQPVNQQVQHQPSWPDPQPVAQQPEAPVSATTPSRNFSGFSF